MKIGNTEHGLRVNFTENEYVLLGRPERIAFTYDAATGILIEPAREGLGSKVYLLKSLNGDYKWSSAISRHHPFHTSNKMFGVEELRGKSVNGQTALAYPMPKMNARVKAYPSRRKVTTEKNINSSPMVINVSRPVVDATEALQYTIDAAVDFINKKKEELGRHLVIQTDEDGFLEILRRSGRT